MPESPPPSHWKSRRSPAPCSERRPHFGPGGRLIYVGAGTSGRLGVLDAAECPPTFGVPPGMVQGMIAGGPGAMFQAVEGAEDDPDLGAAAMIDADVNERDTVVGISASGQAPFVLGALRQAVKRGASTVALTNNRPSEMESVAAVTIAPVVGPEILAGSTRLKSGTAQKMVLNMISTGAMIEIGKTYGNLMVDVQATNRKLKARAVRIVRQVTGATRERAEDALVTGGRLGQTRHCRWCKPASRPTKPARASPTPAASSAALWLKNKV